MTFIKLLVAWTAEMLAHYARHYVWTHIVVTGSCCYVHKPYDYTHPYLQTFEPQLSWWWWRLQLYSVTKLNDLPFSKLVVCQQQFSIRVLKPFAVKTGQCRLLMTQNDDERSHHKHHFLMAMHTEFVSVNFTRPFCSVYFSFYKTKKMIGFKHFDASTLKTCCNYYFVRLSCLEISLNCGSLKMVLWKMNTIQWTCERLVQLYAFIELNWKIGCSMLFISHRYNFDCLENYIHRYCIHSA